MSFEAPIIDQSARSNNGNSTSLGRNFAITATHMNTITDPSSTATNELKWGNTLYATQTNKPQQSGNNGLDVKFLRYRKYIVEGQTEIFDTSLPLTNGRTSKPNETDQKQNLETLKNALEAYKKADGSILAFQAGQGLLSIRGGDGTSFNSAGISDLTGLRGGSFGELWDNMLYGESSVKNYGLQVTVGLTNDFYNAITSGDSGTGFCIYNKKRAKVGFAWGNLHSTGQWGASNIAVATKKDFEAYQKEYEQEIDLKNAGNGGSNGKLTLRMGNRLYQ